ncbi:MAG: DUF4229 domain-containing protein [Mycobacteriales bacterium]
MPTPTSPRPGRAFAVYSALRLALLLVSYAVLVAVGVEGLLAVGGAVLASAVLSLVLLRRQREAFTSASIARTDQRRADKAERRARLDDAGPGPAAG